jgi:hypothetical protein
MSKVNFDAARRNNLARLVASADLQLRGTYDRPLLFGRAMDRGEVTFQAAPRGHTRQYRLHEPLADRAVFDVEAETRCAWPGTRSPSLWGL